MRRFPALVLPLLLLLCLLCPSAAADAQTPVTILFTHDTHSHFLPTSDTDGGQTGGYTRLYTLLEQQRAAADGPVLTLDGGDFSMGTLFQTIFTTDAAELRMLGAMGFDVTTFGNHEYDFRAQGLADMLNAALASGDPLPAIVQGNYRPMTAENSPDADLDGADLAASQSAQDALDAYDVADYVVVERGGVRFAVFGLLGEDADACAPLSGMAFEPIADAAARIVADIKSNADADYIICLSHSGTSSDPSKSEDQLLARAVDGIDVIISGHTHSTLPEPLVENGTLIISAGEYTQNLGVLTLSKDAEGGVVLDDYQLIPVDETVADDPGMLQMTDQFKQAVQEQYLADYGMEFDEVLAHAPFSFTPITEFGHTPGEDPLGSLIADSYIYAVKEAEGPDYISIDFAVVPAGVIRGSFAQGDITVSDAFNVSSLGSGADGTPGYPLISAYVTGRELRDVFEVDASVSPLMPTARLYGAGMHWEFNTKRMIFNKVTDAWQVLEDGTAVQLVDDQLYRIVTGLYSGQMLGTVNAQSFGLLTITPRNADGSEITDFEQCIVHNPNGAEVKEWYALASYLRALGTVPDQYAAPEGRKVAYSSLNPVDLLKNPNWATLTVVGVLLVFIAAIALITVRIRRRRRRR